MDLRGKVTEQHDSLDYASGSQLARPKVRGRVSVTATGQAPDGGKAGLPEARDVCAESGRDRSLDSTLPAAPKDGVHANSSQRASPDLEPKPKRWCFLEATWPTEAGVAATKPPFGFSPPKL